METPGHGAAHPGAGMPVWARGQAEVADGLFRAPVRGVMCRGPLVREYP